MSYANSTALIFEVSQGCGMNCRGCNVDKNLQGLPPDDVFDNLIGMFRDLRDHDVPFMEIELGPTDLITAANREEIFTSSRVAEITRMFRLTTLTSSFIYTDHKEYERLADQTYALAPDNWVGLALPIELNHVFNDKYISRIKQNVDAFANRTKNYLNEVILNVIFDERYFTNIGARSYEELFSRLTDISLTNNTKVDFVFHHGRTKIDSKWVGASLLKAIQELNRYYLSDVRRKQNPQARHVPFQLSCDGRGGEILYHEQELYFRPVLNERITILSDRMKFSGPWTAENYFDNLYRRYDSNIHKALGYNSCGSCEHVGMCADRYIHDLMEVCGTKDCITLLKDHGGFAHIPDAKDIEKLKLG